MKKYKHLSREERYTIKALRSKGDSITSISIIMKRSKGTISMELRRNLESSSYMPCIAHDLYKRRLHKEDGFKIERDVHLKTYIIDAMLSKHWSPDAISGRLKLEGELSNISTESIYRYVYESQEARKISLHLHLPTRRLKRQKWGARKQRYRIPERVSIHHRASEANAREEIGHYEVDLTFHKGNQSANIGAMVDKASQKIILVLNKSKHTKPVISGFLRKIKTIPEAVRKTITMDNGGEFVGHVRLKAKGFKTFFCDPYSPRQKGLVEKMNSMTHRILDQSIDLTTLTQRKIDDVAEILNRLPRKILGYKTPNEVWEEKLGSVQLSP